MLAWPGSSGRGLVMPVRFKRLVRFDGHALYLIMAEADIGLSGVPGGVLALKLAPSRWEKGPLGPYWLLTRGLGLIWRRREVKDDGRSGESGRG